MIVVRQKYFDIQSIELGDGIDSNLMSIPELISGWCEKQNGKFFITFQAPMRPKPTFIIDWAKVTYVKGIGVVRKDDILPELPVSFEFDRARVVDLSMDRESITIVIRLDGDGQQASGNVRTMEAE